MRASPVVLVMTLTAALGALTGCGLQDQMLGASGGLLFQGYDTLATPGQPVKLTASLQGGDYLKGVEGYRVGYYLLDKKIGQALTDDDGLAEIAFTPEAIGNHIVLARLEDPDVRKFAIEAVEIVVSTQTATRPMVIVDLDHTLVASGFGDVLAGRADPMPDSDRVMERLARRRTIIYLTHRPQLFTEGTKRWIRKYNYPTGALLTSTLREFFSGSGPYKSAKIEELKATFPKIEIGIGDKPSDVQAYAANGLKAVLIIHPDAIDTSAEARRMAAELAKLPPEIEVVESWTQVEQALFEGKHFPAGPAIERVNRRAVERERLGETDAEKKGD
jgi:hypothetical protein